MLDQIPFVDSHTEGEPTRLILEGAPGFPSAGPTETRDYLKQSADWLRTAVLAEPRGSEALVGAILTPPTTQGAAAGVVFFNDVGYLGMCGHGMIGLAQTLRFLGRLDLGAHTIDTPAGPVQIEIKNNAQVAVKNVPARRTQKQIPITVPDFGEVRGDVAYGGNWFFLVSDSPIPIQQKKIPDLLAFTRAIRAQLHKQGITGENGQEIDHVELFGPPTRTDADSKSFVLCPGAAYDRSPCGTGTSAKLACLAADGRLQPGQIWRQESVVGSLFQASYQPADGAVLPTIVGRAFVTAQGTLHFDPDDPFRCGIRAS